MFKLTWVSGELPPKDMQIRQVYGVAFSQDGRVLLKIEKFGKKEEYSLIGGTVEEFDKDNEDTLRREMLEEVNVSLGDEIILIGYQMVEGDGDIPAYAQVRMAGMIEKIGQSRPDIDNGKTYGRLLTTPKRAVELLGWGDIGEKILQGAVKIAKENFVITNFSDKEEFV